MASKKFIDIEINKDGSLKFDAKGFEGKGCEEAIKKFQSMGQTTKSEHKAEYHKKSNFNAVIKNGR